MQDPHAAPGGAPPPWTKSTLLRLALAGALVLPPLGFVLAAAIGGSTGWGLALAVLGVATIFVSGAVVGAIVVLVRRRGVPSHAVLALVLGLLGLPAIAVSTVFSFLFTSPALHGRPHRVGGRARRTGTRPGVDWVDLERAPSLAGIEPAVRAELASGWLADASLEHASIAAFSTLSLDLIALGAPPSLIARTHRAALDEVAHARDCFALASAYAGGPHTAAPFPEAQAPRGAETREARLARVAVEAAVDGCVGEGAAAAIARAAAAHAIDPVVVAVLERIARDEETHADLARDVLAWCLREGDDDLRRVVDRALAREHEPPDAPMPEAHALARHGRMPDEAWAHARRRARAAVRAFLDAAGAVGPAPSVRGDSVPSSVRYLRGSRPRTPEPAPAAPRSATLT